MCRLIARLAVLVVQGYSTWSVVIFMVLLFGETTNRAKKVSAERTAAHAATALAVPTPTATPTPEDQLDRMYKLFHIGG
ncbi:MAG: hypothetical protein JOZ21_10755 [Verrucomicrobia bacterium]|nr:hypothetical protein [Verrucomicrobiota bacterium]